MLYILCDDINIGKSSYLMDFAQRLIQQGYYIGGWITPPAFEDDKKIGHDFVAIDNNTLSPAVPFTRPHAFENSVFILNRYFNMDAFNENTDPNRNYDLFIMDEIGPLELKSQQGFSTSFHTAITNQPNALIVLRRSLKKHIPNINAQDTPVIFELCDAQDIESLIQRTQIQTTISANAHKSG